MPGNKRRKKKQSIKKQIKSTLVSMAEKKSKDNVYAPVVTPGYPNISTPSDTGPFLAYDLIRIARGTQDNQRIGDECRALKLKVRCTFQLAINHQGFVDRPAYIQVLVVKWPNKQTDAHPIDMKYVLTQMNDDYTADSYEELYNSPYNRHANMSYKILKRKNLVLVDRTSTQLRTLNFSLPVRNLKLGFGSTETDTVGPPKNSIGLYILCNRPDVTFCMTSNLIYTDL